MWGVRTESLQLTPEPRVSGGGDAGPWSVMCYHCTMGVCRGGGGHHFLFLPMHGDIG